MHISISVNSQVFEAQLTEEFIKITYVDSSNREFNEYHVSPVDKTDKNNQQFGKKSEENFNILIIMLESMSNANTQRQMRKTYNFLETDQNTVILKV